MIRRLPPSIGALVARGASILASFALTVVVARVLPVAGAGSFFVVYTVGAVVATFGRYGIDTLAIKLLGGGASAPGELRHGWQLVTLAGTIGAVAFGGILSAMSVHELGGPGVLWAALTIPPQALAVVAGAVLRSRGRMIAGIIAELGSIPSVTCLILLVARLGPGVNLDGAVGALALATWLTAAWSVPLAVRASAGHRSSSVGAGSFIEFLRRRGAALSSMMATALIFYAVAWAPVLTLTMVGRPEEVAWVTAAARLANMVTLVPSIQVSYLAPQFSSLYHGGAIVELNRLARASSRRALLVVVVPSLLLAVAAPQLVSLLYGPEFEEAAPLLSVLAVGALLVVGMGQVNQLMLICDFERWGLALSVAVVAVWATLGLWLASQQGAEGVVVLSAVGNVAYAAVAAALLRLKRGVRSSI